MVYTNLWISCGAFFFGWLFYQFSGNEIDFNTLGFLFFSTLLTYTFQRYIKIYYKEMIAGPRMLWMVRNIQLSKIILYASLIGTIFFALYLSLTSLILLTLLGAISFFYAYKFNLTSKRTNLRDIPGIKIFLIGLVWAISCSIIPSIEAQSLCKTEWFIFLSYLLYIIGITIPFDIRDIDVDEINKKTIPQLLGVRNAIALSSLLILISGIGFYTVVESNVKMEMGIILGTSLSLILTSLTHKKRDELYFSFLLDGLLVFYPIMVVLLSRPDLVSY